MKKLPVNAMNASQQSQINISLIFNYLKEKGSANRSRIAADLNLSLPAVSRGTGNLEEAGFISRNSSKTHSARKGTPVYRVNASFAYVLAVDLFSIRTEAIVVDMSGQVKHREKGFRPENSNDISGDLIALIDSCRKNFLSENGEPSDKIMAAGIGVPAVVNRQTGSLVLSCYEVYEKINFVDLLESRYGIPVFVENICALSALGEKKYGKRKTKESLVFIEIGAGIGSGILLDGSVYRGSGFAGEIGFSLTGNFDQNTSRWQNKFLENQASLSALKYNVIRELSLGHESSLRPDFLKDQSSVTPVLIFEHALNGDELCGSAIADMVKHISATIHNLTVILNPDAIVIGGDVCLQPGADRLVVAPVINLLGHSLPFATPDISISSLGNESGILGAAALAIDSIMQKEFPYQHRTVVS